jgi:hypothetical protein
MADADRSLPSPRDWRAALSALPLASPPADGWTQLSLRLDHRIRRRARPAWLAAAAAVLLALALPWQLQDTAGVAPPVADTAHAAAALDPLQQLHAESAQLESLLQLVRDDRVSSGTAAALAGELEARIAAIDAALMQPGLARDRQQQLWQARVDALRAATGLEGTRRWLVAQGARYDTALAQVD